MECKKYSMTRAMSNPLYRTWRNMQRRVKTEKAYADLSIDEAWHSFEQFASDMGPRPDGMTLERKDNSKGYSKDNCIWATRRAQQCNRGVSKHPGVEHIRNRGRWRARININGIKKHLGTFDTCEEAQAAYWKAHHEQEGSK